MVSTSLIQSIFFGCTVCWIKTIDPNIYFDSFLDQLWQCHDVNQYIFQYHFIANTFGKINPRKLSKCEYIIMIIIVNKLQKVTYRWNLIFLFLGRGGARARRPKALKRSASGMNREWPRIKFLNFGWHFLEFFCDYPIIICGWLIEFNFLLFAVNLAHINYWLFKTRHWKNEEWSIIYWVKFLWLSLCAIPFSKQLITSCLVPISSRITIFNIIQEPIAKIMSKINILMVDHYDAIIH